MYSTSNPDKSNMFNSLTYSFKASLPVMAGYIVLGIGFGILLADIGYSWWWALLMSICIYAGSMQYVAINLLSVGATLIVTAMMTLMVNIRHLFYGITMLKKYKNAGIEKPYIIFALTDETFSLVCSPEIPKSVDIRKYYFFLSALNQTYWIIGCVTGALLGNIIPFDTTGIDFSMTALFAIIFIEQWEKATTHIPAITGVVISVVCLFIFGSGNFLIPSMILITIALFLEKRWIGENND